ncbi:hypothetical protein Esti_001267 [Eimeria stiedai]
MLKFFFLQWAFVVVLATLPSNSNQRYHTEGSPDQTEARLVSRIPAILQAITFCREKTYTGKQQLSAFNELNCFHIVNHQKPSVLTPSFLGVPPDALVGVEAFSLELNCKYTLEHSSTRSTRVLRQEIQNCREVPVKGKQRSMSRDSPSGGPCSRDECLTILAALQNQETTAASDRELLAELGEGDGGPPARAPTEAPGAGTTTRQPVEGFEAPSFDVAGGAPEEETQKNRQSKLTSFAAPTLADAGQPPAGAARAEGEPAFAPPGFAVAEPTELANTEERGEGTQFQPPAFGVAKPTNLQQQQQEEAKEVEAQEAAETENFAAPVFGASAPGFEGLGGGAYTPEGRTPRGALAAATTRETPPPIAGPSVGPENPHAAVSGSAEAEAREREERLRKRELELQRQQEQLQQQQQQLLQQQQLQQPQPAIPYPQQQQQQAQQQVRAVLRQTTLCMPHATPSCIQLEPVLSALQRLDQRIAELHALAQQQQQQQLQQQQQQGEMLRQHHERLEQALQQQQQQQQVQPQQPQQPPMPTETSVTAASPVAAAPAAAVEAPPAAALPSAAAPPPATPLPPATAAVPPITIENCNCSGTVIALEQYQSKSEAHLLLFRLLRGRRPRTRSAL